MKRLAAIAAILLATEAAAAARVIAIEGATVYPAPGERLAGAPGVVPHGRGPSVGPAPMAPAGARPLAGTRHGLRPPG